MKPYAAKDHKFNVRDTDSAGNVYYARASRVGNLPGKGGDIHSNARNAESKRRTRTLWNKRARAALKRALAEEME